LNVPVVAAAPSPVATLARTGLQRMDAAETREASRRLGDRFLGQIQKDPGATADEKALAAAADTACGKRLSVESAVEGHRIALKVLAGGLQGPLAQVIARVGADTLSAAYDDEDARKLGTSFLASVQQAATSPADRALAETAAAASGARLTESSAREAQAAALKTLASPSAASPLKALAHFGTQTANVAYDNEDARAMARHVLSGISTHVGGDVGTAALLAHDASGRKMTNESARGVQSAAFKLFAENPTATLEEIAPKIAAAGMQSACDEEDARTIGDGFLAGLAKHSTRPEVKEFADAARGIAGKRLAQESGAAVERAALQRIADGVAGDPLETSLARLGLKAAELAYDSEDATTISKAVMTRLSSSDDARVKTLTTLAAKTARKLPEEFAGTVGQRILQAIVDRPGEASNDATRAGLQQAAEIQRDIADTIDRGLPGKEAALAQASGRLVDIGTRMSELYTIDAPLVKRLHLYAKVAKIGLLGTGGGLLGLILSGSPIAAGVALVGGAALIGGFIGQMKVGAQHSKVGAEAMRLWHEQQMLTTSADMLQSDVDSTKQALADVRAALRETDAELAKGTFEKIIAAPVNPDTVNVEEDVVTIGGLKIPRRTASENEDARRKSAGQERT